MEKVLFELICILIIIYIVVKIVKNISDARCNVKEVNLEKYNIELNSELDKEALSTLDGIIYEAFDNYLMIHIKLQEEIINAKLEKKIRDDLIEKISNELSPILVTKLSAYYNTNSIGGIIAEKVYKLVMEFALKSKNKS